MKILKYDYLPKEAMEVRIKVFVDEQGFIDEIDEIDDTAVHFVAFDNIKPIGTCRIFKSGDSYILGRLAVLKDYRKKGVGKALLEFAEKTAHNFGSNSLMLHSQTHAIEFYQKCGYVAFGDIEYEQDCPHIWMKKEF